MGFKLWPTVFTESGSKYQVFEFEILGSTATYKLFYKLKKIWVQLGSVSEPVLFTIKQCWGAGPFYN